jgi:phage gp45-like
VRYTAQEFAEQIGAFRRQVAGIVRRMSITLTEGGTWQTVGHFLFGTDRETRTPEHYPGIGIAARPPAGSASAEALVLQVGGQNQPAIVATRDEATRAQVADVAADETAIYNSLARVHAKDDGTIEARTHGGTAVPLCTLAEAQAIASKLNALIVSYNAHVHPGVTSGSSSSLVTLSVQTPVAAPTGTTKLKGE